MPPTASANAIALYFVKLNTLFDDAECHGLQIEPFVNILIFYYGIADFYPTFAVEGAGEVCDMYSADQPFPDVEDIYYKLYEYLIAELAGMLTRTSSSASTLSVPYGRRRSSAQRVSRGGLSRSVHSRTRSKNTHSVRTTACSPQPRISQRRGVQQRWRNAMHASQPVSLQLRRIRQQGQRQWSQELPRPLRTALHPSQTHTPLLHFRRRSAFKK